MKIEFRKLKWWQWFFAIGFFPFILTILVLQKKGWSLSKRLKVVGGAWVGLFVVAVLHGLFFAPTPIQRESSVSTSQSSTPREENKQEVQSFTEDDALRKIKRYEVETTLMGVTEKRTLEFHYAFLANLDKQNKDLGWTAEKESDNSYLVTHRMQSGSVVGEAKWRVTNDSMEAINGVARTITPELVKNTVGGADQAMYDLFNTHLSRLMDSKPSNTTAQLDAIYEEAYVAVAKEFKVTVEEAKTAVQRAIQANSRL